MGYNRGTDECTSRKRKPKYFDRSKVNVPPARTKTVEDGSGIFHEFTEPISHPEWYSLCPLDGRYAAIQDLLSQFFSEYALMSYRVYVELEWVYFLLEKDILPISENILEQYYNFYKTFSFNVHSMEWIKEKESKIKHDVKAVEYYVRSELSKAGLEILCPYVHIGCTSEDINSTAYALILKDGMNVWLKAASDIIEKIRNISLEYADTAMLSHTHGQPASTTTVGKEFAVYYSRLFESFNYLTSVRLTAKFGGATGNHSAMSIAFPYENWLEYAEEFITHWIGVDYALITTQIESHDNICRLLNEMSLFNNILLDLESDIWMYISMEYIKQIPVKDEVGSSTMPQKINPINFENGIGNATISNALCQGIANKLPISRMQRDLSDSTVMRNVGLAIGYSLQTIKETLRGLNKIAVNEEKLSTDLNQHWEILGEAVQTVLRKYGDDTAYEKLKEFTRGKIITKELLHEFISNLELPVEEIESLLSLTPADYTGWSEIIAENIDILE